MDKDVTRNSFEFSDLDEEVRRNIEADSFWCMTKVLDGIQDNYTFAQPGIQVLTKTCQRSFAKSFTIIGVGTKHFLMFR